MIRMLTLNEWAQLKFSSNLPCDNHLRNLAKNGLFEPPAVKVGKFWRIREDAEILPFSPKPALKTDNPRLKRILEDGCKTSPAQC